MIDYRKFQDMNEFYRAFNRIKGEVFKFKEFGSPVLVYSFDNNDDRNCIADFLEVWLKSENIKYKIYKDKNYGGDEFYIVIVK